MKINRSLAHHFSCAQLYRHENLEKKKQESGRRGYTRTPDGSKISRWDYEKQFPRGIINNTGGERFLIKLEARRRSLDRARRSECKKSSNSRKGGIYARVRSSLLRERERERFVCEDGATMCLGTYARKEGKGEPGKRKVEKRGEIASAKKVDARGAILLLDKQMNSSDNSWPGCRWFY